VSVLPYDPPADRDGARAYRAAYLRAATWNATVLAAAAGTVEAKERKRADARAYARAASRKGRR
jgi:hypothetical protein